MVALTGIIPKQAYLDEEYGGDKQSMHTPDPKSELPTRPSWPVFISKWKARKPLLAAELKHRSAIEPAIGHTKADHCIRENYIKGRSSDRFNIKIPAIGSNFSLILKWLVPSDLRPLSLVTENISY